MIKQEFQKIRIENVNVSAGNGASVEAAMQEALLLCAQEKIDVIVTHNVTRYAIFYNDIFNACFKRKEEVARKP